MSSQQNDNMSKDFDVFITANTDYTTGQRKGRESKSKT